MTAITGIGTLILLDEVEVESAAAQSTVTVALPSCQFSGGEVLNNDGGGTDFKRHFRELEISIPEVMRKDSPYRRATGE
jgi:hypothetical protein